MRLLAIVVVDAKNRGIRRCRVRLLPPCRLTMMCTAIEASVSINIDIYINTHINITAQTARRGRLHRAHSRQAVEARRSPTTGGDMKVKNDHVLRETIEKKSSLDRCHHNSCSRTARALRTQNHRTLTQAAPSKRFVNLTGARCSRSSTHGSSGFGSRQVP